MFLIQSLMKACKLINDQVNRHLQIQKDLLHALLRKVHSVYEDSSNNQPYLSLLYRTMFSTAYYGMLRVGEIATGDHPVLAWDVHIAKNKQKMLFVLRSSKTHWRNDKPQVVKITSEMKTCSRAPTKLMKNFCPFQLLRQFAKARGPYINVTDPFSIFSDGSPSDTIPAQQMFQVHAGFIEN